MPAKDSNTTDSDNARLNMIRNAVHGVKRDNADTSTTNESKTQKVKKNTSKAEPDLYLESDDNPERASCDISAGTLFEKFLKRRQYVESGRWSVAELKISFPELQELVGWLQSAEQYEINETHDRGWSKALDPSSRYTNKVVVGLLLHIIYAESVRRYGTEGSYWSCVYNQLPWKESNRRHLFIHNGQPSSFHREILENSAQALKMRHTFGIDGVQQWFSTGFLQFGFTYGGFKRRLGEWLAGYHTSTNAIEALTHDRELRSDSFASLWGNLSRYRLGQLTDAQLENRIKDSCWILNEWVSDLKLAAKQKLHLGTQLGRREGSDTDPEFLSNPALAFSNTGQPEFNFRLTGLIELPLTADRYTLTIDEQPKLDLIRQNDGGYDPIGDEDFTVPWTKYQIQAAVKDSRTGTQIASQTLNMWQPDEFLHVFTENGRKYQDAFALKGNPGNSVHIMFPTLLSHEIEGNENSTWTSPDDTWTIISISPDVNVRLLLEGELFWELKDALKPSNELIQGREFINNALSVEVSPVDVQSGLLLTTIKVAAHESISIRWARIGFEALDFEEGTKRAVLPILPEYLERGVSIQFAVEAFGQKVLIRKRIQIPYSGAFWISSDGVKYEVPRVLHTQDVSKIKLCAFPRGASPDDDTSGYCITEGNHFSRRLAKNAIQLSGLSGLGSPLFLNKGLFNQFDTPQVLADAVIDGGCIHQVKISEDCLTVFPSIFTGLKDNFIPIVWVGTEGNMRLEKLKLEEGTVSETEHQVWRAQNSFSNEQINAIGIFLRGRVHWLLVELIKLDHGIKRLPHK